DFRPRALSRLAARRRGAAARLHGGHRAGGRSGDRGAIPAGGPHRLARHRGSAPARSGAATARQRDRTDGGAQHRRRRAGRAAGDHLRQYRGGHRVERRPVRGWREPGGLGVSMARSDPLAWLAAELEDLRQHHLARTLTDFESAPEPEVMLQGRKFLLLASNNYLGLASDPRVLNAATDAVRRFGASTTASRLVSGSTVLHRELEAELAALKGAEAAILFSSG